MVLEPLFPKLTENKILYRCYIEKGKIYLELGSKFVQNYTKVTPKMDLISGTQMINPQIRYEINNDNYKLDKTSGQFDYRVQKKVEGFLNEIFTFRDDHHVTEYK